MEAEEAQDAQIIFGDARRRIADEAHTARLEIGKPADIIVHDAVGRKRERVHGEVAPLRVALPVAAEAHRRVAAEGLDVLAQRRHLERPALDHHRDGAVVDAGRHRLEAGGRGAAHHLRRQRRGRDIDVAQRHAEQRVAHRAADDARLLAVAVERREQVRERGLAQPGRRSLVDAGHFIVPGTSLPFSICAGT